MAAGRSHLVVHRLIHPEIPEEGVGAAVLSAGSFVVVLADHPLADEAAVRGRRAGLELRDTILILRPGPSAGFAFLFRKPVQEDTVTDQMVKTSTGGINIRACRVASASLPAPSVGPGFGSQTKTNVLQGFRPKDYYEGTSFLYEPDALGRWPPNVVLVHAPGCLNVGTKKARATSIHGTATAVRRSGVHAEAGGHQTIGREQPVRGYADAEGQEAIPAWECVSSCPVGLLGDGEGASRFFPQFRDEAELLDWLGRLLEPL